LNSQEEHILDAPDQEPKPSRHLLLAYVSLAFLAIAVPLKLVGGDWWVTFAGFGLIGMTTRNALIFFRKKQSLYAWCYFIGSTILILALFLYFFHLKFAIPTLFVACFFFLAGILLVSFRKKDAEQALLDDKEEEEED
jgi:predicted membrane protein